jgi:hypothetical protein
MTVDEGPSTLDLAQHILRNPPASETILGLSSPRRSIPKSIQNFFDRHCDTVFSGTAAIAKQSIAAHNCDNLSSLVARLLSLILLPFGAETDLVKAAPEILTCFELLDSRLDNSSDSEHSDSLLRLFVLTVILLSVTSPHELRHFLSNLVMGRYNTTALVRSNGERLIRWFERLETCPSPIIRCHWKEMADAIVDVCEVCNPYTQVRMKEYVAEGKLKKAWDSVQPLPRDWADESRFRRARGGKRAAANDLGPTFAVHLNPVFVPEPTLRRTIQMRPYDYGPIKRHINCVDNGRCPEIDWMTLAKEDEIEQGTNCDWLCLSDR